MTAIVRQDAEIQKDILAELKWSPDVEETDIGVIVKNGAVTLTGTVPKYSSKEAAKNAAKRIKGVRAIANEMLVKLPSQMQGTDDEIAKRISNIFAWNAQIPGDDIKAEVANGIVTLSGSVDWQFQKTKARELIEPIKGVKAVLNNVVIRKHMTTKDVKSEILKALHRHAGVEAEHVKVSVSDGTVTLSGNVDSYIDLEIIEDAAWAAPGVVKVIDNLHVH